MLKELSQRFVFELEGPTWHTITNSVSMELRKLEGKVGKTFKGQQNNNNLSPKDKLLALKIIRECNQAKFALFK